MIATRFLQADIERIERQDGSIVLRERQALRPYKTRLGDYLRLWAGTAPERTFLAERQADQQWRKISYAETLQSVEQLAAGLLGLNLSNKRPIMLLSGNSIRFALLQLAALHVGLPVAPISPAYSLQSKDFSRLQAIATLLAPGLIFIEDMVSFQPALEALATTLEDVDYCVLAAEHCDSWPGALAFDKLSATYDKPAKNAVYDAYHRVTPATIAKILFTSGSTGQPKGVLNTQRMLCSNQQALLQSWPFLTARPPVIVDWLPWHHTFGGNHNFNMILRHGGTLYIDHGKPLPGAIEKTVANLREIAPTIYFNVPAGYDALIAYLEQDRILAEKFFFDLDLLFCAAAALPASLAQRLQQLAQAIRGTPLPFVTAWGSTETAPLATVTPISAALSVAKIATMPAGWVGVPVPGTELKLAPIEAMEADDSNSLKNTFELRVRGPNVMSGYWRLPKESMHAFDDEGFYRTGDGGRLLNSADPNQGLLLSGRLAENFKLATGSWVQTSALRVALIAACSPLVRDVIIAGQDQVEIGVLLLLNPAGCKSVLGQSLLGKKTAQMSLLELARQTKLRTHLGFLLRQYNAHHASSSLRVGRALLLTEPLSIDAGELTDKGYINQAVVLRLRAASVAKLYSDHPEVLVMPP